MKSRFILAGTMVVPLLLPAHAAAPEQPSFQIAQQQQQQQQRPDADERRKRREQRQEKRQEQKQKAQEKRQDRRENARDRRQEQRQEKRQEQKQKAQEKREDRRENVRDRRQEQRQEKRQEQKQKAQEKREDRRENVRDRRQEKREDRRENVRDRRQEQRKDQREDAREQRQDRREDARERREDRRENVRDRREERREDAQRARRLEQLRERRRESREGKRTVIREPGRTIIREGNRTIIRHNEVDRFRRFGRDVRVERRGNLTHTIVVRPGGVRIITITDRNGRLVRRIRRFPDGREVVIIDNRPRGGPGFFVQIAPPVIRIPRERYIVEAAEAPPALLYDTLVAPPVEPIDRAYALDEIRYTENLRARMPRIDLDTITFDFGSWEVTPAEAARLEPIAQAMLKAIEKDPAEVFLIEGHTDAVGDEIDNLSLSDRRAEEVAIVLTDMYQVPPENLTTQGYGEQYLKVPTQEAERANRRVTVRRITPLLAGKGGPQNGGG